MQKPVDEKNSKIKLYLFDCQNIYIYTHTLNFKKLFIQKKKKNHTCLNVFFNWLPAMLNTTRFLGQKSGGSNGNGYSCQSSNFNPLGRYSRRPQQCTLQIVSNLRFFILQNICGFNSNFIGSGGYNIML